MCLDGGWKSLLLRHVLNHDFLVMVKGKRSVGLSLNLSSRCCCLFLSDWTSGLWRIVCSELFFRRHMRLLALSSLGGHADVSQKVTGRIRYRKPLSGA